MNLHFIFARGLMEITAFTRVADTAALLELHEPVHLENDVLFPRVVSLQARAEGRDGPAGGAR